MIGDEFVFPRVKTMGSKDTEGGTENSQKFLSYFYSQLTHSQILKLYELYETDFLAFKYFTDDYMSK